MFQLGFVSASQRRVSPRWNPRPHWAPGRFDGFPSRHGGTPIYGWFGMEKYKKQNIRKMGWFWGVTPWIRWIGNLQLVSKFKLLIQINLWSPTRQGKTHCYPLLQDAASRLIGESPFFALQIKLRRMEFDTDIATSSTLLARMLLTDSLNLCLWAASEAAVIIICSWFMFILY